MCFIKVLGHLKPLFFHLSQIENGLQFKPQDTANIRSTELLAWFGNEDLDLILKERYGHVERSNSAVKIVGKHGPGRPKMTWKQLTERDCREWKLSDIDPHDRDTWRSGARSAMRAASQLPGRGPLLWILPLYLHVDQKSDDDDELALGIPIFKHIRVFFLLQMYNR